MERYDYHEAVYNDVVNYIRENVNFADYDNMDDLAEALNDRLWTCDSVTGNASGSYTFSAWEAQENICHNLDLLDEAVHEYGGAADLGEAIIQGAETCDVIIRCYLLPGAIAEALEDMEDEFDAAHGGECDDE